MENIFKVKKHFEIKTTLPKDETLKRISNRTKIFMIVGGRLIRRGKDNAAFIGSIIGDDVSIYNRKAFKIKYKGRMASRYRVKIKADVTDSGEYTAIKGMISPSFLYSPNIYIIYLYILLAICMLTGIFTDEHPATVGRVIAWLVMYIPIFLFWQSNLAKIYKRLIKKTETMLLTSFKNHMYEKE